ncbi:MAG: hypothetical protein Q8S73_38505 [Deltaproteobacteria bacterium]|nr:hypothetical protein [Myxococcales bacterium]MDP3220056.1 hypothetical protein [Deltaproteobacteria bacterium]
MITDDERRAMRARVDAADRGPWRAGTVEHEGKVWAPDPDALGGPSVGERCVFNANTHYPHTANRVFVAAAREDVPRLLDEVERITDEAAELRAILAGREKPPSVEEIVAHAAAHPWGGDPTAGRWLVRAPNLASGAECSSVVVLRHLPDGRVFCAMPSGKWIELPDNPSGVHEPGSRWWPLDGRGAPCAMPRVTP